MSVAAPALVALPSTKDFVRWATGLAAATANAMLDGLCRSVVWSEPAAFYIKLHLADPGSAGTTSPAAETTRKLATFSAASGGAITTSGAIQWTSYPAAETVTHVSFWDAVTAGTFIGSDALDTSRVMAIGDTLTIAAGDVDVTFTVAA